LPNPISRLFRRRSLRADARRAVQSGVGLYQEQWQLPAKEEATDTSKLADEIISWCRDTLGRMCRPYGLDYVTGAVALLDEANEEMSSTNLGVLRPEDFYGNGRAEAEIREALDEWLEKRVLADGCDCRLSAVLFSWVDLTRELLPAG